MALNTFTLTTSMSNEDGLIVFVDGKITDNVYSVSGTTLTFVTAPVNGRVIEVFQMEGGIVGTAWQFCNNDRRWL